MAACQRKPRTYTALGHFFTVYSLGAIWSNLHSMYKLVRTRNARNRKPSSQVPLKWHKRSSPRCWIHFHQWDLQLNSASPILCLDRKFKISKQEASIKHHLVNHPLVICKQRDTLGALERALHRLGNYAYWKILKGHLFWVWGSITSWIICFKKSHLFPSSITHS